MFDQPQTTLDEIVELDKRFAAVLDHGKQLMLVSQKQLEDRGKFVDVNVGKLLQKQRGTTTEKMDALVVSYSDPAITRALNLYLANHHMELLIHEVMAVLTGKVANPFKQLMEDYRHGYSAYLEGIGKLARIFELHSVDLVLANQEGPQQLLGAFGTLKNALNAIPDLSEHRNKLERSVDALSIEIVDLAASVNSKIKELLEEAANLLKVARENFAQAEIEYKSNLTAAMYFGQHKENRQARINFLDHRIKQMNGAISEQEDKLREAQRKEKQTTKTVSKEISILGIEYGFKNSSSDVVNTDWTQKRCKARKVELLQEKAKLEQQMDDIVNMNQSDETSVKKLQESFKRTFDMEKEKLHKAEEYFTKVKSEYMADTLASGGVNPEIMVTMTQILLHLKTFALVALPNLSFIGQTKQEVMNLLTDKQISARRIIAALRPLASAYVEEEVLLHQTCTRGFNPDLKNFYVSMNSTKARSLEADPAIREGNPANVDNFAATPSEPPTYPL